MIVIEDECDVVGKSSECIYQGNQSGLNWWWLRKTEQCQNIIPNISNDRFQCSDNIAPEASGVIIVCIEGDPGDAPAVFRRCCTPGAEQGRLAKSGRCGNKRKFAVYLCVELIYQARAGDHVGASRGDVEFRR